MLILCVRNDENCGQKKTSAFPKNYRYKVWINKQKEKKNKSINEYFLFFEWFSVCSQSVHTKIKKSFIPFTSTLLRSFISIITLKKTNRKETRRRQNISLFLKRSFIFDWWLRVWSSVVKRAKDLKIRIWNKNVGKWNFLIVHRIVNVICWLGNSETESMTKMKTVAVVHVFVRFLHHSLRKKKEKLLFILNISWAREP